MLTSRSSIVYAAVVGIFLVTAQPQQLPPAPDRTWINCFVVEPGAFLIGAAEMYLPKLRSQTDCMWQCRHAQANFGFECASLMWYIAAGDCVLSATSRTQKPEVFSFSQAHLVDYYENVCIRQKNMRKSGQQPIALSLEQDVAVVAPPQRITETEQNDQFGNNAPATIGRVNQKRIRGPRPNDGVVEINPQQGNSERTFRPDQNEDGEITTVRVSQSRIRTAESSDPQSNGRMTGAHEESLEELNSRAPTSNLGDVREAITSTDADGKEIRCFVQFSAKELIGFEEESAAGLSLDACLKLCRQRTVGKKFLCASVNYFMATQNCVLNGADKEMGDERFISSPTADYYEHQCSLGVEPLQNLATQRTPNLSCFQKQPNTILLELDGVVLSNVTSARACLIECLHAPKRYFITCKSLSWFESFQACTLYKVGRVGNEALFKLSPNVDFYENNCESIIDDLSTESTIDLKENNNEVVEPEQTALKPAPSSPSISVGASEDREKSTKLAPVGKATTIEIISSPAAAPAPAQPPSSVHTPTIKAPSTGTAALPPAAPSPPSPPATKTKADDYYDAIGG